MLFFNLKLRKKIKMLLTMGFESAPTSCVGCGFELALDARGGQGVGKG
jgi:hypothetical protein